MPGVPSGKGCAACRKQKKKCDQGKPACSRCTRLRIECVGSGEQRYTFKNQSVAVTAAGSSQAISIPTQAIAPAPTPSNAMTLAASGFMSALQVTDIRYDLSIYGAFFKEIPRRMGTNDALDASVYALTKASSSVRTHQVSPELYDSYSYALKMLRVCLDDPEKTRSSETLCAIYLLMILQGWIGKRDDQCPNHGEVMAYLLNAAVPNKWEGQFESDLLVTLTIIAIMESFFNPKIRLEPWLLIFPEHFGPRSAPSDMSVIESLKIRALARVPEFLQHPSLYWNEIRVYYQQLQADTATMRTVHTSIQNAFHSPDTPGSALHILRRHHVRYSTAYGIVLCIAIILNAVICSYEPTISLAHESAIFVDIVIDLAEQASQYRPLGSSSMPLFLMAALAVTDDLAKRTHVERVLLEYQNDFSSARWIDMSSWLRSKLADHRFDCSLNYLQ
ncbi:hypothetical protein BT63DRAFT_392410 [Microthyrium microscopicum]|uniref:Zn(2)-C6 fungal-type domain-containing protein n=1 Tax=Microthyrium microscopicum TaxID=703497 RepID=A0A6A6TYA5_9PEZI|nr:hypothetical protein BT63DRAFT_392410 [Microthyrium microscopicum]